MAKETVYTNEVVEKMVDEYKAGQTDEERASIVESLANELGVKIHSVRAKLVSEKVYIPKTRTTKNGDKVESKADIVGHIAEALGVEEEVVESLEKATKPVLKMLRNALQDKEQIPFEDENPSQV